MFLNNIRYTKILAEEVRLGGGQEETVTAFS